MLSQRSLVAIDIGASSVKVLEFSGTRHRKLAAVGLELLAPGSVVDGEIKDENAVVDACRTLLDKLRIMPQSRRAAIAMGGSGVTVKRISVQVDPNGDLNEQIYYEAEQYLQQDVSDLYFRFQVLSQAPDQRGAVPVLLAGARRDFVEQQIAAVRRAGLRIGVVDCSVLALANMFEFNYPAIEPLVGILNVGASASQLVLLQGGQPLFCRDIFLAGDEYTRQISEVLGISVENAEGLKVATCVGEQQAPAEVQRVMDELNEQLVGEVRASLEFFQQSPESDGARGPINYLLLSGGGARTLGLDAALAASLQVPVQLARPMQNIDVSPSRFDLDYLLSQGHLYGVAAGLGLRFIGDHES